MQAIPILFDVDMPGTNDLTVADAAIPIDRNYKQELMKEYRQFVRG